MTNEKQISTDRILLNQKNEAMKELKLYTTKETCATLKISSITLWRLRKAGKITFRLVASKIVYLREDLENYLEQNKRGGFAVNGGENV